MQTRKLISTALMVAAAAWSFAAGSSDVVLSPQLPVPLGTSQNFVVLAAAAITNTGVSTLITGNIGLSPTTGLAITGITQANVVGTIYTADGLGPAGNVQDTAGLIQAQNDLTVAYIDAAGRITPDIVYGVPTDIGGLTLAPGLYKFNSSAGISGSNLTLSGPSTGVWIFQIASTLTVASGIRVTLSGGALASNVFWQVGSSATMITTAHMEGTIMAQISITFQTGATLNGRALARTGAVTLDTFSGSLPSSCATGAPGALTATAGSAPPGINLNWSAVSGATAYNIYRATLSGGPYTLISTAAAPATTYFDAAVLGGVWYYYVVRAVNVCASVNSPEASATLPTICTTGAPLSLVARMNIFNHLIKLTWTPVAGVTSYNVYRATVSGGPYALIGSVPAPQTTYDDVTVLNDVRYYYVIRAFSGCESGNSPEATSAFQCIRYWSKPRNWDEWNYPMCALDEDWSPIGVTAMRVSKGALPNTVVLNFPDNIEAAGYNIYEGSLTSVYSHANAPGNACNVLTTLVAGRRVSPVTGIGTSGSHYYLVTAYNDIVEGPSGYNSSGVETPRAMSTCAN